MKNKSNGNGDLVGNFLAAIVILIISINVFNKCSSNDDNTARGKTESVDSTPEYETCYKCGKLCKSSEMKMFETSTKIYHSVCRDCYERLEFQKGLKAARNQWVDDNPYEARRRGIEKF